MKSLPSRVVSMCIATTLAAAALVPAGATPAPTASRRGELVGATRVARMSAAKVRRLLAGSGIASGQATDPIDAYRLVYRTIAPSGAPTTASGLLVLPRTASTQLPSLVFEHGTTVSRAEAPSVGADSFARLVALLDGSAGFATIAPDYLGTGVGPGRQAYLQVRTEVSASVDLVRAARAFAATRGRSLGRRLLVSGFSQGGQAAMGLGKALQAGKAGGLTLGGLAAVSGPYDLQHAEIPAILEGRTEATSSNYNLAFFALSWKRLYGMYGERREAFRPGTGKVIGLFDGEHPESQIFAALPDRLDGLFTPTFLNRLAHPGGRLLRALRVNDATCSWRPAVPVRLYFSRSDEVVAPLNTRHCVAQLRARGATVKAVDIGQVPHLESIGVAAPQMLRWLRGSLDQVADAG